MSFSGDTAAIGARSESPSGAVYIYLRSGTTWAYQQKLVPTAVGAIEFGAAVAVSGDTVAVGAPGSNEVYVFVRSGATWSPQQTLTGAGLAAGSRLGRVAISGDTLIAGAFRDDTPGGEDSGSAYVFVRSGSVWSEQQKLTASDGAASDFFGLRVDVAGDTALVGASGADRPSQQDAGAAYVFVRSGTVWSEQQKLTASDGAAFDNFGSSASISGDTALVGAYGVDGPGLASGAAYVFVRSGGTWSEQQKLTASDARATAFFGISASLSGETAFVGAPNDIPLPPGSGGGVGSAYVFVRAGGTWSEQQKLRASGRERTDELGIASSLSGDTALVGAWFSDSTETVHSGAAHAFVRSGTSWSEQQTFPLPEAAAFYPVLPCRVVDTRTTQPLLANSSRSFGVAERCSVPSDARAVVAILTAVNPTDPGNLRVFAVGHAMPSTSALNFAAGRTRAGNGVLLLGGGGDVGVYCEMPAGSAGSTHLLVDVMGFYR